jgi:hypothetical protein
MMDEKMNDQEQQNPVQPMVPLLERVRSLITLGDYLSSLDLLAREAVKPVTPRLAELGVFAEMRLGRYSEALRWIEAADKTTAKLRRLEIEVLAAMLAPQEILEKLRRSFAEFPQNAPDYAFYSINELVFNGAFTEARWVIDHAMPLFQQYQPGSQHDFAERKKYIDSTERICAAARTDSRFELTRVKQRLVEIDVPTIDWGSIVAGEFGLVTAEVSNCLQGLSRRTKAVGSARFFRSPSKGPYAPGVLMPAKPTRGFLLRDVKLSNLNGTINIACAKGVIFPELAAPGSTTNAGFSLVRRDIPRKTESKAFLLPPLGDPGHFNAVMNGLFGMVIWVTWFSNMRLVVPPGYSTILRSYAQLLDCDLEKIVWNEECEHYEFDTCLVLFNEGRHVTGDSLSILRSIAHERLRSTPSEGLCQPWIYVSRRKARQRPLQGESELESMLMAIGFRILCFEELSPGEQIMACRYAKGVVAPHGAGLTNLVFAENLEWLVEMIPETYHVRGFENLATQMGAAYVGIIGQAVGGTSMEGLSWTVDPAEVVKLVRSLIN